MRSKIFMTLFGLCIGLLSYAQTPKKISSSLLQRIQQAERSDQPVPVLISGNLESIAGAVGALGGHYKYGAGKVAAVSIPLDQIHALAGYPGIRYINDAKSKMTLLNDQMLHNNNVIPLHQGLPPLQQAYKGDGVLIGIIDTGIETDHPDFRKSDGTTRIKFIWDQTDTGTPPAGYTYGREWTESNINSGQSTHDDQPFGGGHGSNVAGIAGGDGSAVNNYGGIAPNADFLIVSLGFGDMFLTHFVDAVAYIFDKADQLGKPCVINASVGSFYGSWDGRDDVTQIIDSMIAAKEGRVLVNAAGNSGNREFHLGYDVTADTCFTWFKYKTNILGEDSDGIYFTLYADAEDFDQVSFAFGVDDPANYSLRGLTPFDQIQNRLDQYVYEHILSGNDTIGTIRTFATRAHYDSSLYHMVVKIFTDSTAYYWRFITTGSGKFDIWSGANKDFETATSDMIKSSQLPDSSQMPAIVRYKAPDNRKTLVSSWNCSPHVISVANYNNRNVWTDVYGNYQIRTDIPGEISGTSSSGPTRDGASAKPDLAATGNFIITSARLASLFGFWGPQDIALGGMHNVNGGTSMAAPVVTGLAALYLQKVKEEENRIATHTEIKYSLIHNTRQDSFTTFNVPNDRWGYGKVDGYKAISNPAVIGCTDPAAFNYDPGATVDNGECIPFIYGCTDDFALNYDSLANTDDGSCIYTTGISPNDPDGVVLSLAPNPTRTTAVMQYRIRGSYSEARILMSDITGAVRQEWILDRNAGYLNSGQHPAGIYFINIELDRQRFPAQKLVICQ